ncbi:unnamed protein product, partial [Rotaria socialis]
NHMSLCNFANCEVRQLYICRWRTSSRNSPIGELLVGHSPIWRITSGCSPIGENYNWRNHELAIRYYPNHIYVN